MFWPLIWTVSSRRLRWGVTTYVFPELSPITPLYLELWIILNDNDNLTRKICKLICTDSVAEWRKWNSLKVCKPIFCVGVPISDFIWLSTGENISCTTIHRYPIFSTWYSVMCRVYTGYHVTSEIEHCLCACRVDNPLAKALRTGAQTMLFLSLTLYTGCISLTYTLYFLSLTLYTCINMIESYQNTHSAWL